ncbi:adenylate/guanylate cyclase domain-containing protein [Ureibacillus chungkukjangi]|uniref:adenylate/guanylate cyclase domain-containing protein n=1 Tax=Ureibacillus chungkukjangi TaxID=1202712 RepID=UPI00203FD184|nr:adenylate/guanylate cyclase domain-containing protein [Ureibacillus chungkukjangi]MCM3389970.1 adenylate/guanylate cyclase domain-containing protein [Ureibacillus chungkukjangi]
MRSSHKSFNLENSLKRIDSILYDSTSYEESDDIPDIDDLTFTNGKYVKCAAIFIDLRGSTDLIKTQGKLSKSLARLYRAYISEMVAIVNSFKTCKEINIVGDCVSAMFAGDIEGAESPVIEALQASSMSNAMMNALNVKYKKKWKDFYELKAGIGVAYGRALVIKAGFSGSGIKDLVYMGDVVNKASKMCGLAYKKYTSHAICVTEEVYVSAGTYIANAEKQQTFQDFLTEKNHNTFGNVYVGNFHRESINNWAEENK